MKLKLEQRLCDLETLPEMLRSTELKLQDSQERLHTYEKKNIENTKLIVELTSKVGNIIIYNFSNKSLI